MTAERGGIIHSTTRLTTALSRAVPGKVTVKTAPDLPARQLEERRRQVTEQFLKAHGVK
jgi:hypothetical protein